MDHRRSSFVFGSRTGRNILQGKVVRKQNDGADNFADYWTDSGEEDASNASSHLLQAEKEQSISECRLKSLRQSVRNISGSSGSNLHSGTKIKDKQGHTKFLKSPLKHVKNKTSNCGKSIHSRLDKKHKLSPKLQQFAYRKSGNVNNISNSVGQSVRSESSLSPSNFHHSISNSKVVKNRNNNNNNKKECTELNTSQQLDNLKRNLSPLLLKSSKKEKTISVSHKGKSRNLEEIISKIQDSNANVSSGICTENSFSPLSKQSVEKRETLVINENVSDVNCNASDIHMLPPAKVIVADLSPQTSKTGQSEFNDLTNEASNKINSHVWHREISCSSKSNFGNLTVNKRKSISQISKTFAKYDEYDERIMQIAHDNEKSLKVPEKERTHSLSLKPAQENQTKPNQSKNSAKCVETYAVTPKNTDGNIDAQNSDCVSNKIHTSRKGLKRCALKNKINEELFSDKRRFEVAHTSLNHKLQTKNKPLSKSMISLANSFEASSRDVNVSLRNGKSSDSRLFKKRKSTIPFFSPKLNLSNENKNRQPLTNILMKSADKNDTEQDTRNNQINEVEAANVSCFDDDIAMFHVSEVQDNDASNDLKRSYIDKSMEAIQKSVSGDNFEVVSENLEVVKQSACQNKQGKVINENQKSFKDSKIFPKKNGECAPRISEIEEKIIENLGNKKRIHVNKIQKNSRTINNKSVTDISTNENEITQSFDNEKGKHIDKTRKGKASETFSIYTTAAAALAEENEITQDLDNGKAKHVNKTRKVKASETFFTETTTVHVPAEENEIHGRKRKKTANKTQGRGKVSKTFPAKNTENFTDIPAKESESSQNVNSKKKKHVNKITENSKVLKTFSKDSTKSVTAFPQNLYNEREKLANKENPKSVETFSKDNQSVDEHLEAENKITSVAKKNKKLKNDRNLSITENNDQPKKKKKKEILSTQDGALRRSKRQKFAPLAKWRNERFIYRLEQGTITVAGVDKGTGEDLAFKPFQEKKNREKQTRVKKICVEDYERKKKFRMALIKKFHTVPWDKKYEDERCPYRIKRVFESENCACGFIEIKAHEEKPKQYMPNEDIHITTLSGKVQVTIQNDVNLVEEKDMFFIPRRVPYSLKNAGSKKALLTFIVGKFEHFVNNLE